MPKTQGATPMSTTSAPAAPEAGSDPAAKLRKLRELRQEGLLTQEEYETERIEVLNSI